jgi:quercetin 2,3-dioxygenase
MKEHSYLFIMKTTIYTADSRGGADHGWLRTKHSFSFASYFDAARMGFGSLRVLNDDVIAPGKGFSTHPHSDMEIVTIVQRGELEHKDSTGAQSVLRAGEVQVMSAGSGIYHSEYNHSTRSELALFQLWIEPREKGLAPRHEEREFEKRKNAFVTLASGSEKEGIIIYQDAHVRLGWFEKGQSYSHNLYQGWGSFVMVVEGKARVAGVELSRRDAVSVEDAGEYNIIAEEDVELLVIDVKL